MPSKATNSFTIDRTGETAEASCHVIRFLQGERGARLIQVFGLPLMGKTTFAQTVCDVAEVHCAQNRIPLKFTHVYYETTIKSYIAKVSADNDLNVISTLADLEHCALSVSGWKSLILLDNFAHPDWISRLLENPNCCCVVTTKNEMNFPRLGWQIFKKKLSPLTPAESQEYMMKHLRQREWTYQLSKIVESCQGFPRVLRNVTEALCLNHACPADLHKLSFQELCSKFLSKEEYFHYHAKLDRQVQRVDAMMPAVYLPSLSIMRGSFRIPDLAAVSNISENVVVKRVLMRPLFKLGIVSESEGTGGHDHFIINDIICSLLEDRYGYLQSESDLHNRFCKYFAKMFSDLEKRMVSDVDSFFTIFLGMYPNLLALVERAVYCLKEEYDVLINVAYQAELIMMGFLQAKEVVTFYEACTKAAKERGNMTDYARMLSSFGHSLLVICPDVDFAGEKISEALDLMKRDKNISATEIALTTSHRGHYLHLKGNPAAGMRCYEEALSMYKKCLEEEGSLQIHQDAARIKFLKYSQVRMKNNIAISAGCLGQLDYSIQLHQENIQTYKEMFSSDIGMGKAYHCIGLMLHLKGERQGALKYAKRGLAIKRKAHSKGPSLSIIYSTSLVAMSYFLSEEQEAERALCLLDDAIAMIDDLKKSHADRSLLLNGKGEIHLKLGNYAKARDLLKEASDIRMAEFGIGANCCSGESLQFLGEAHFHLGELYEAVETFKKCLCLQLVYYKQSPRNFEENMLNTAKWLRKSLVEYNPELSILDFVDEFITKADAVINYQKVEDAPKLATAKEELCAVAERAFSRLDLKVPHFAITEKGNATSK